LEGIHRARILTQAAEHAAGEIVSESGQFFAARLLVALAPYHDQRLGARQGAQIAGDTQRLTVIRVDVQPRCATVALGHLGTFGRVLLGIDIFWILIAKRNAEPLQQVHQKNSSQKLSHVFYRSTSPSTISNVPIIATTSATRPPRTMRSSAWRLTNDG